MIQKKTKKEIKVLHSKFQEDGFVLIPNYFETEFATKVRKYIALDMPSDQWHEAASPVLDEELERAGDNYGKRCLPIDNSTLDLRKARAAYARTAAGNSEFAYNFHRTVGCSPPCGCMLCKLKDAYESIEVISLLNEITELNLGRTNTTFASRYIANHFLTSHSDLDRGILGVVYYINQNWNPTWGGLLHIQGESQIEQIIAPEFNTMGLFTLPKAHFVSQISNFTKWPRYNHVAWYDGRTEFNEKLPRDGEDFEE